MILYEVSIHYYVVNLSCNSPFLLSHLVCTLHPSTLCSLSLYHSSLQFTIIELWSFILLKRFLWLRVRYESMDEIHLFFLFSIMIIWLVACWVHKNSNRFNLIFKIWNLYISCHATWFAYEFVKTQIHMSILCHLALVDY